MPVNYFNYLAAGMQTALKLIECESEVIMSIKTIETMIDRERSNPNRDQAWLNRLERLLKEAQHVHTQMLIAKLEAENRKLRERTRI